MEAGRTADLALRRCTHRDYVALVTWIDSPAALYAFTGPVLSWPLTLDQLEALRHIQGRTDWTLIHPSVPDEALGHVEVTTTGTRARLSRVIVSPSSRGRGWGRALVALALDEARRQGADEAELSVVRGNEVALRTYLALGFVPLDGDDDPDALAMVARLPAAAAGSSPG